MDIHRGQHTILHGTVWIFFAFVWCVSFLTSSVLYAQSGADNWLITKVDASKENVNSSLEQTMRAGIMPQAIDRNEKGNFLFLSQKIPPARLSKEWQLLRYKSEREMMVSMRSLAQEGWTPAGMDIQSDGAFVQYVQNNLTIINARIIKIKKVDKISNTMQVYRDLDFLPAAISTYEDQLWFLFAQYEGVSASDFEIIVKSGNALDIPSVIKAGLSSDKTEIVDMTLTANSKVIIVFVNRI